MKSWDLFSEIFRRKI